MEAVILVVYDIRDDKLRLAVSKFLKKLGFTRIQKSVFVREYDKGLFSSVEGGLRRVVKGWVNFDIQVFVISRSSFNERIVISEGYRLSEFDEEEFLI